MSSSPEILHALSSTSKGKLKYDKTWFEDGRLQAILEECCKTPVVSGPVSPNVSLKVQNDEADNSIISVGSGRKTGSIGDLRNLNNSCNDDYGFRSRSNMSYASTDSGGSHNISPGQKSKSKNSSKTSPKMRLTAKDNSPFNKHDKSPLQNNSPRGTNQETIRSNWVESAIKKCETQCKEQAKEKVNAKKEELRRQLLLIQQQAETRQLELDLKIEEHNNKTQAQMEALNREKLLEVKQRQLKLKEHHKMHARLLDVKRREAEEKQHQMELEQNRKDAEAKKRIEALVSSLEKVVGIKQTMERKIKDCRHQAQLEENIKVTCPQIVLNIYTKINEMLQSCAEIGDVSSDQMEQILQLVKKANNSMEIVTSAIDTVDRAANEEEQKKAAAEIAAKAAAEAKAGAEAAAPAANIIDPLKLAEEVLAQYQSHLARVSEAEKAGLALSADPRLKKYKFDLQKAVTLPVNTISTQSGSHLRDKLEKVHSILSGKQVEVGSKRVNPSEHPMAVPFCKDLFAKKIVSKGDEEVSANHKSAFPIAAVTVGVMCEFPELSELICGHFYKKCPYLVPYHPSRQPGQSSEDFHRSLGYTYDEEGNVEKQDKYLKRMSGLMRLYAAIIVSTPPRGPQHPHPYGLEMGWLWLTRLLNMDPWPDVTATLLYDFLVVAGNAFMQAYKIQFHKLLFVLCTDYVKKINAVTPKGSGGPVGRLMNFLEKSMRTSKVPQPEGYLPPNFWFSH